MASSPLSIPDGFDALRHDEKVSFIEALWERAAADLGLTPEQLREARRRQDELLRGEVETMAAEQVFAELRGS